MKSFIGAHYTKRKYLMFKSKFQKEKVYCIGFGKTGTTTIEQVLKDFNYRLGHQPTAEMLVYDYFNRDFSKIIDYCHTADAFQDIPFNSNFLYVHLDQLFPNAKFILTVRDSADQWYDSLVRFHSKKWANGKRAPNKEELLNAKYRTSTFAYDTKNILFGTEDNDLYNKEKLIACYNRHNDSVRDYFRSKTNFIEVNVSNNSDYKRIAEFLGKKPMGDEFPWLNKT